ncbi:hypothetical protein J5N97_019901 [Dioscorea zingiberensis]|uniref:PB1 domain-containing protein n=1 Tax=Dioscorea zingiberensis TaxID=325984 RepID=A0A9D5HD57_9LILI|nr:hypothetical protein J5N97_019901 [Dioscorea zingiberensis]
MYNSEREEDSNACNFGFKGKLNACNSGVEKLGLGTELQVKLGQLCGWGRVAMRCKLPTEDLDVLVSVTSDEDLANLIEEYDLAVRDKPPPWKIRAFLHPAPPSKPSNPLPPPSQKGKSPIYAQPPIPLVPPPIGACARCGRHLGPKAGPGDRPAM